MDNQSEGSKKGEDLQNFSLKVIEVDEEIFADKKRTHSNATNIEWDTWAEGNASEDIINEEASPCSIVYIKAGEIVLSGHFLNADSNNFDSHAGELIKQAEVRFKKEFPNATEIKVPTKRELTHFEDAEELFRKHQEYRTFFRRVKELIEVYGKDNVEAYLFGQNFETKWGELDNFIDTSLDRVYLIADLVASGIVPSKIDDHRSRMNDTKEDNTIYLSDDKTIYVWKSIKEEEDE